VTSRAVRLALLARLAVGLSLAFALLLPAAAAPAPSGAAELVPPMATRFADLAWYQVVDASVLGGSDLLRLRVELGAIDPSGGLPLGITQPIVELYLDTGPGGASHLLPGSGMRMPEGDGWNAAVRLTGDGAWGWLADEEGAVDVARPVPLDAVASGRTIDVLTPFAAAPGARLYVITGVYDPFRADGWRPTTRDASPWAFSSPAASLPVVDVFPGDGAAKARALAQGVLPRPSGPAFDVRGGAWVALMLLGLGVATLGLWWRRAAPAVPAHEVPVSPAGDGPAPAGDRPAPADVLPAPAGDRPAPAGDRPAPATAVDDEVLIGDDDVEGLLARRGERSGAPEPAPADGVGTPVAAAVPDPSARGDEPELVAVADEEAAPVTAPRIRIIRPPDAFAAFERSTHDENEDQEGDRLQPST
jgi:hypothetical protein